MFPFIYTPDKSNIVLKKTNEFFERNKKIEEEISEFSWIYHSLSNSIPQTAENFWSGHYFPFMESWEELQVSFNLVQFGFYKQAMVSLRSAMELGLLSVYYNINDEGHETVQNWLNSKDNREADTPRMKSIWNILIQNPNIKEFQEKLDLKEKLLNLGYLHNYVHTKGFKHSNRFGLSKSNSQTFEKKGLNE